MPNPRPLSNFLSQLRPAAQHGQSTSDQRRLRFESLEDRRLLTVFSVTNLNDAGSGSLRAAIELANNNNGADEIVFSGIGSFGVISLTSGEIEISDALTINGPGQNSLTIDANLQSRIFDITEFTGDVSLIGLTLTNGLTSGDAESGGAVRSLLSGSLTIDKSFVYQSSTTGASSRGAGVYSYNALTITDSTFSENRTTGANSHGGGVFTANALTITGSTFSGNGIAGMSSLGGGIATDGDVTLMNSTVSGNSANGSSIGGAGIAILSFTGDLTLSHSTVTDNHANPFNATGGGVRTDNGSITITNSIIAKNTAGGGSPDLKPGTGALSVSYSLIGVADGLPFGAATNKTGTAANPLDPQLGPLTDNGGSTLTHNPSRFSRVLDSGDPGIEPQPNSVDQRGIPFNRVVASPLVNPFGPRIDIGAVERQSLPASFFVVNTTNDELDYGDADVSLREAINSANATPANSVITFDPSLSGQTITLGGTQLEITRPASIDATALGDSVVIDGDELSRIFDITASNGDFTLAGLTLTGGRTTGFVEHGGAVRSLTLGTLTIDQSIVRGNRVLGLNGKGGGLHSEGGAVVLTGSTVSGNRTASSGGNGGGISSFSGDVTLYSSTVSSNRTDGNGSSGGGINSFGGNVKMLNSTVSGNRTTGSGSSGGGIASNSPISVVNSTVTENEALHATSEGGGIWNYSSAIDIRNSIIANNLANGGRPDIMPGTGPLTVDYSLIQQTGLPIIGSNNVTGLPANLEVLSDNGGLTATHALLPDSLAVNAGDPGFNPADFSPPLLNDQRGLGFDRVSDARIDIGAFETQATPPLLGDANGDGSVDLLDLDILGTNFGLTPAVFSQGDFNNDGTVDLLDLDILGSKFGASAPAFAEALEPTASLEAAFALLSTWEPSLSGRGPNVVISSVAVADSDDLLLLLATSSVRRSEAATSSYEQEPAEEADEKADTSSLDASLSVF